MDALVLSVVASESTYGYKITQDVRSVMEVSESTLYPVLHILMHLFCHLLHHRILKSVHPDNLHGFFCSDGLKDRFCRLKISSGSQGMCTHQLCPCI